MSALLRISFVQRIQYCSPPSSPLFIFGTPNRLYPQNCINFNSLPLLRNIPCIFIGAINRPFVLLHAIRICNNLPRHYQGAKCPLINILVEKVTVNASSRVPNKWSNKMLVYHLLLSAPPFLVTTCSSLSCCWFTPPSMINGHLCNHDPLTPLYILELFSDSCRPSLVHSIIVFHYCCLFTAPFGLYCLFTFS